MATCVVSLEEFDAATGVDKVVMVLFGASFYWQCKSIGTFFVKAAASGEYPDLGFLTVDIGASPWCQRPGLNPHGTAMLQAWRAGALLRTIAFDKLDEVQRELEQYQVEADGPGASKRVFSSLEGTRSRPRLSKRLSKRVSSSIETKYPRLGNAIISLVCAIPFLLVGSMITGITHRVVYYDKAAEKHWASGRCRVWERHVKTVPCDYNRGPRETTFYVSWLSVELVDEQQTFLGNFSAFKKPSFSKNCGGSSNCGRGRHCFNQKDNAKRFVKKYNAGQTYGCDYDPDHPRKIAMKNTGSGLMSHYIAGVFFMCFAVCWCCFLCCCLANLNEEKEPTTAPDPEAVIMAEAVLSPTPT